MEPERQVEGFFLPLLHEEHFHGGLGLWKKKTRKKGRKEKPTMLLYRHPNNRFPSWVSNSTSHLKRSSCCFWGCWSSGEQSSLAIKWPQGMQTGLLSPTEHNSNRKSCRACLPLLWMALPWSWPGEVGAPVLGDSRSRAPFVLSPLCVFLMGISVKHMECNHIVVLKGSLMIENMSIYYFPRDREKNTKLQWMKKIMLVHCITFFQQRILRWFSFKKKKYFSSIL